MRVSELYVYPIKSTRGVAVDAAAVEPWGLAGDRRWMVIDESGTAVTAREEHRLLAVRPDLPDPDGGLAVRGPHADPLRLTPPDDAGVPVRLHRHDLRAIPAGPAADAWFSALLGRAVRLVWCDDPTRRQTNPEYSRQGDSAAFADGYPLLLTTTESLRRLNDWVTEMGLERGEFPGAPLPMRRFRPSVVLDGAPEPFAEDHWQGVRVGEVTFRVAKPCDRCVMTTIDPDTLVGGHEPIRTLSRYRHWDGKTWFGMNLIPDGTGTLHIGDVAEVVD